MKFTWDISFGTLASMATFLSVAVPVFIRMGKMIQIFKDYPPHLHIGGRIKYPRGMTPDDGVIIGKLDRWGR